MNRDEESYRLWRARRTICQMLRDRGYIVEQTDLDMKYETFRQHFSDTSTDMRQHGEAAMRYEGVSRSRLGMISNLQSDPSEGIFVFFPEEPSIGVDQIRQYASIPLCVCVCVCLFYHCCCCCNSCSCSCSCCVTSRIETHSHNIEYLPIITIIIMLLGYTIA